jgi:hypothetical protein
MGEMLVYLAMWLYCSVGPPAHTIPTVSDEACQALKPVIRAEMLLASEYSMMYECVSYEESWPEEDCWGGGPQ